ncbi:MAG: CoA ester lyase [Bacillota bacterium]
MKILRSVLFAPGDDPKKAGKAFSCGADAVVLDLEDAVAPERKDAAREIAGKVLAEIQTGSTRRVPVFVRVNPVSSPYILKDLQAVIEFPIEGIMLAKAEAGEEVRRVDWLLGLLEQQKGITPGSLGLIPFIESARGIERAIEIAGACARVWCLAFGGNDYTMDIGTTYSREGSELFYARCRLVAASRVAGLVPPLDTVNPDFRDIPALVEEARRVKQLGFQGKLVIHPAQVAPVNEVFTPAPGEIEWAKKVVAAFDQARARGAGVIQLEGRMVELPVVRRAQQILALTEVVPDRPPQD